jgi:hypothetical protein
MCRNVTGVRRNIHALTASPASGAVTIAAVPAKGNKRQERKNQRLNLAIYKIAGP